MCAGTASFPDHHSHHLPERLCCIPEAALELQLRPEAEQVTSSGWTENGISREIFQVGCSLGHRQEQTWPTSAHIQAHTLLTAALLGQHHRCHLTEQEIKGPRQEVACPGQWILLIIRAAVSKLKCSHFGSSWAQGSNRAVFTLPGHRQGKLRPRRIRDMPKALSKPGVERR